MDEIKGQSVIKSFVKTLPDDPGVYRMIGEKDDVLYVGKAKSLKNRVNNYTNLNGLPHRLKMMVSLTRKMEFVVTHTEAEALLLEAQLIKSLKPRFNILLKDDKSFPYIHITGDHGYPMVRKHRGVKRARGDYYGPFANTGAVNRTLSILQRVFMIRNCNDHVFANRARPCLQYHIKRCTAPCVDYVSKEEYGQQIAEAKAFLDGDSRAIQDRFAQKMKEASDATNFEKAAFYRDRIYALNAVQSHQDVALEEVKNADVICLKQEGGRSCVQVFFFRNGQNYGNHSFFPEHDEEKTSAEILEAVMLQFYQTKIPPREIFVNEALGDKDLVERALSRQAQNFDAIGYQVKINKPARGARKRLIDFVAKNAKAALQRHIAHKDSETKMLEGLAELFSLDQMPERIEVYDNSHISGTNMVGAMIVGGVNGFQKNAYRKFNIKTAKASDDYGMMREVLQRRFKNGLQEVSEESWPDIVLIDGGQGQFNVAKEVLEELGVFDELFLVSIAKGPERNAGRETFFVEGRESFTMKTNDPVLYYLQRLRDEAHRFAIGSHRAKRSKEGLRSELDQIPGIGPSRKRALLHHFGSAKAVADASVQDLMKVEGISRHTAQLISDFFREGKVS